MRVIGKGSVVQRDKSKPRSKCRDWELSCVVEDNGEKRRRTKAFHGTWTQAQAALEEWRSELEGAVLNGDTPLSEYLAVWHARRASSGLYAHKTMKNEGLRLRPITKVVGDVPLCSITPDFLVQRFGMYRSKYAQSTLAIMWENLDTCLTAACRDGLIASVPTKQAKRPRSARTNEQKALSNSEMDTLASALDPTDGRQLGVMLCLLCGLRAGEAVALRWSDWDGESIHVERADDGLGKDKPPKTVAGVRTVPAPPILRDALESMRGDPSEPVCVAWSGGRMTSNDLSMWWTGHKKKFGCRCTLHELRHSYLTRLARAGVHPRTMMQLAGHSSIDVCMEIYTHVSDDMSRDAVSRAFG